MAAEGPGVELPVGGMAPVIPTSDGIPRWNSDTAPTVSVAMYANAATDPSAVSVRGGVIPNQEALSWKTTALQADLSSATAVTINALREAFQVKLLERDARGGSRYTEIIRSHFGVVSPDARLQRPEYLGGGTVAVNINPVAQTSGTSASGTGGYGDSPG